MHRPDDELYARLMQDGLEGLFFAAFNTLSDAAIAIDCQGKVVAGNPAFFSMFGFSRTDWTNLPFDQLCVDVDRNECSGPAASRALAQTVTRRRYRRHDGTILWGERSVAPIQGSDGTCLGFFSIIRDVTDSVSFEQGLTSMLALPGMRSQAAPPAMVRLLDLGCRHFGVEHGNLCRLEAQDYIVDAVAGSLDLYQVGQELPLRDVFGATIRGQDGLLAIGQGPLVSFSQHAHHQQTDLGSFLAVEVQLAGLPYGALIFADRSSSERELREPEKLLLRVIAHWIGMLLEEQAARKGLGIATQDLERFAHIASHDLQEPLRRVVTYCQILMEDFGPEVSDEATEVIEIIQTGGRRMHLMLNDLLVYSRLNQQLQQSFEPVDMSSILGHALDDLASKLEANGAKLEIAHLPLVWGRGALLQMVCYHLLSNALKFSGDQTPRIDVAIEDRGRCWQFSVTDHGIGIEPRFAHRIFDIFQRLHSRDDISGSGTGLAICKLIVERHGGAIWLDTTYHEGARFLFTLPKDRLAADSAIRSKVPSQSDLALL